VDFSQRLTPDGGQEMIGVIVPRINGEIAVDALDRAWPDEAARATRFYNVVHRFRRPLFHQEPGTNAGAHCFAGASQSRETCSR